MSRVTLILLLAYLGGSVEGTFYQVDRSGDQCICQRAAVTPQDEKRTLLEVLTSVIWTQVPLSIQFILRDLLLNKDLGFMVNGVNFIKPQLDVTPIDYKRVDAEDDDPYSPYSQEPVNQVPYRTVDFGNPHVNEPVGDKGFDFERDEPQGDGGQKAPGINFGISLGLSGDKPYVNQEPEYDLFETGVKPERVPRQGTQGPQGYPSPSKWNSPEYGSLNLGVDSVFSPTTGVSFGTPKLDFEGYNGQRTIVPGTGAFHTYSSHQIPLGSQRGLGAQKPEILQGSFNMGMSQSSTSGISGVSELDPIEGNQIINYRPRTVMHTTGQILQPGMVHYSYTKPGAIKWYSQGVQGPTAYNFHTNTNTNIPHCTDCSGMSSSIPITLPGPLPIAPEVPVEITDSEANKRKFFTLIHSLGSVAVDQRGASANRDSNLGDLNYAGRDNNPPVELDTIEQPVAPAAPVEQNRRALVTKPGAFKRFIRRLRRN